MDLRCLLPNCRVKSDLFLNCWLCDGYGHFSCAGFSGRDFDKIRKAGGLRWSCWNCRNLDVNFFKLFKEAKIGFSEISKDLSKLHDKFNVMDNLFAKFELDYGSETSPKRKRLASNLHVNLSTDAEMPTAPISPQFIAIAVPEVATNRNSDVSVDSETLTVPSINITGVDNGLVPVTNSSSIVKESENIDASVSEILLVPPEKQIENQGSVGPNYNGSSYAAVAASSFTPAFDGPGTSSSVMSSIDLGVVSAKLSSVFSGPEVISGSTSNRFDELVVVPPRKTVFLSRLGPSTTVDNVKNYLRNHCEGYNDTDISVVKFKFSEPRDISSFRIIAPLKIFDILMEKSFWPQDILVREFTHRDRPRAGRAVTLPKN